MTRLQRVLRTRRRPRINTSDGVRMREGLRVHSTDRGNGTVLRVLDADGVVVRWDLESSEPRRTTFIAPAAVTSCERRVLRLRRRRAALPAEPAPETTAA